MAAISFGEQGLEWPAKEFIGFIAEHSLSRWVYRKDYAVLVYDDEPFHHALKDVLEGIAGRGKQVLWVRHGSKNMMKIILFHDQNESSQVADPPTFAW